MSYVRYSSFIELAGLSGHAHQLERRISKYPGHFKLEQGTIWMSRELAQALVAYHLAAAELEVLQKGGNNHG